MAGVGRNKHKNPVILAGLSFLVFAPIELIVGYTLHNPAISANASHDAFDGIFFLLGGSLDLLLARSSRHALYCWSRKGLSIGVGLLASVFVGVGLLIEQASNDGQANVGSAQLMAALVLGPFSIFLNWFWHKRVEDHGDEHHHGYDVHLLVDVGSGFIVIIAGILTIRTGNAQMNLWGGLAILGLALYLGAMSLMRDFPALLHKPVNHPTSADHGPSR